MPVCIIAVPENEVNLLDEWQVSQVELVGTWAAVFETIVTP